MRDRNKQPPAEPRSVGAARTTTGSHPMNRPQEKGVFGGMAGKRIVDEQIVAEQNETPGAMPPRAFAGRFSRLAWLSLLGCTPAEPNSVSPGKAQYSSNPRPRHPFLAGIEIHKSTKAPTGSVNPKWPKAPIGSTPKKHHDPRSTNPEFCINRDHTIGLSPFTGDSEAPRQVDFQAAARQQRRRRHPRRPLGRPGIGGQMPRRTAGTGPHLVEISLCYFLRRVITPPPPTR